MSNIVRAKQPDINRDSDSIQSDTRKAVNKHSRMYEQAIICTKCLTATIAEYDALTNAAVLYDYVPYLSQIKIRHRHTCDSRTKARVLEMVTAEQRLLEVWDPNDFVVYLDQNIATSLDGEHYCSLDNSLHQSRKRPNVVFSFQRSTTANQRVDETSDRRANYI